MSPELLTALDAFPDLLVIADAAGEIVAANRVFAQAFGTPGEDLAGRYLFDILETPVERAGAYLHRCAGSRQFLPGALTFRTPGGEHLDCQCSGAALRPAGDIGRGAVLLRCRPKAGAISRFTALNQKITELTREITSRHHAEAQLRDLNATLEQRIDERTREIKEVFDKLNESERHFRHLVESVSGLRDLHAQSGRVCVELEQRRASASRITRRTRSSDSISRRFYTESRSLTAACPRALATADAPGDSRSKVAGAQGRRSVLGERDINAVHDDAGHLLGFAKVTRDLTEQAGDRGAAAVRCRRWRRSAN